MANPSKDDPVTPTGPRFQFNGTMTVEIQVTWMDNSPPTLHHAEELMMRELDGQIGLIRGRVAQAIAPPGDIILKGQLLDIHHHTRISIKRESHAPAKAFVAGGNAGLRGPGDEHRPNGREARDGQGTGQHDVSQAGPA
jgi:hypothetical protein